MALVVHHYFPMGSGNIGDAMVARAIRAQLRRHLGPCDFVDVPVNDRYTGGDREIGLRGGNVDRSNAEADLVVIGGSNLLEPRKPRRDEAGVRRGRWSVFTSADDIARLRRPTLLIGMGHGSSFGKPMRPYVEPTRTEVAGLFARSFAHSVRDVATVRRLADIGVSTICTGCPVTFLEPTPITAQGDGRPLAVSLPPFYIGGSWAGRRFLAGTVAYIRWLVRRGVPVLVTLHEDRDVAWAREHLPAGVETFYTEDLDEQLDRLRATRGMIGFRLHAALTAIALGKPVIPVGIDWRGLGFIETIDAADISIRSGRLGQWGKLRALTDRLLADDPVLIGRLAAAKAALIGKHETFLAGAATAFGRLRAADTAPRAAAR